MTVLVLDSPELIALAAAMDAAQAGTNDEVQAEDSRAAEPPTDAAPTPEAACAAGDDALHQPPCEPVHEPRREDTLALVI